MFFIEVILPPNKSDDLQIFDAISKYIACKVHAFLVRLPLCYHTSLCLRSKICFRQARSIHRSLNQRIFEMHGVQKAPKPFVLSDCAVQRIEVFALPSTALSRWMMFLMRKHAVI